MTGCNNWNRSAKGEKQCCSFCLEFTEMFNNLSFFSLLMPCLEKSSKARQRRKSKKNNKKNPQKNKLINKKSKVKMRLRKFWGMGSFHPLFERTRRRKDWKSTNAVCRIQSSCSGIHISSSIPHIIVYKWPNQTRQASNSRFHLSIQPQEATATESLC